MISPVFSWKRGPCPPSFRSSQMGALRLHCHTMALCTGLRVSRSHNTVVSLWLVMPMPTISEGDADIFSRVRCIMATVVSQITSGLCSTQPARGYICENSE
ncbi:MAG: hypothetical protein BWZ01_02512 [Deltaproteobacteria bacterium ADurb.BinA179]|nr:MAG: hypothetical protein BWZ01_02512 [Deltaproteobacteria bacterium ADurb.BinA179]